jgi:hypothetical protein
MMRRKGSVVQAPPFDGDGDQASSSKAYFETLLEVPTQRCLSTAESKDLDLIEGDLLQPGQPFEDVKGRHVSFSFVRLAFPVCPPTKPKWSIPEPHPPAITMSTANDTNMTLVSILSVTVRAFRHRNPAELI